MVTNQSDQPANIWRVPVAEASQAVKLTASNAAYGSLNWTPDGRIVYEVVAGARGSDRSQVNLSASMTLWPKSLSDRPLQAEINIPTQ